MTANLNSRRDHSQPDSLRFAHLSDPHLSTPSGSFLDLMNKRGLSYLSWRRRRRFRHRLDVLERVVADAREHRPDHWLVTGDLTHVGLPGEFDQGRTWLEAITGPHNATVVPGNHERLIDRDFHRGLARWQPYLTDEDTPVSYPTLRRRGAVALIAVNSAWVSAPGLATGCVGEEQRAALGRLLLRARQSGWFRLVLIHHSPFPDGHHRRKRLTDAGELLEVLSEHGAELVVHGHGHVADVREVMTGSGAMVVIGAPSASLVGDGAAGWNEYRIGSLGNGWRLDVEERRNGDRGMATATTAHYEFEPATTV